VRQWIERAVYKFGYLLETPRIPRYSFMSEAIAIVDHMSSDNASGADNQQGRLDAYIAGFVDGEGSFHVAIQRNATTRAGWQLVPEFHVSQNPERRQVLDLIRARLGCGRIRQNHRASRDTSLVYVVRGRNDLLNKIIPFFETQPLLSSKQQDFEAFAMIVRAMSKGEHLLEEGFERLRSIAVSMNGGGKYRRVHVMRSPEPSETIRRTPASSKGDGEDMVRPAWRHAEPGRNDPATDQAASLAGVTEVSVPIHRGRRKLEEGCP
jgi:hypothetical protein